MEINTSCDKLMALSAELDEIERRRPDIQDTPRDDVTGQGDEDLNRRMDRLQLTALCLSGGGIRSAAFSLGVLQALAGGRLLGKFDYLSTVSGGGYIGGWLQMRIRDSSVAKVEEAIMAPNAPDLHALRRFTNFLTPQTGPFTTDTWTGVVLYLRNLLLNWMVFTPLFLALALLAVVYRTVIFALYQSPAANVLLFAVAAAGLVAAVLHTCNSLPSHVVNGKYIEPRVIVRKIVVPVAVWSLVLPCVVEHAFTLGRMRASEPAVSSWHNGSPVLAEWLLGHLWAFGLAHFVVMLTGYCVAWGMTDKGHRDRRLYWKNFWPWAAASGIVALLTFLVVQWLQPGSRLYQFMYLEFLTHGHHSIDLETVLATFGPLLFSGLHLLQTAFYVGMRREGEYSELDREWLARVSAQILLIGVGWTLFAFCCVVLAPLLLTTRIGSSDFLYARGTAGMAAGTTLLGALIAWAGKKAAYEIKQVATKAARSLTVLLDVGAAAFAILLFALAGSLLQYTLGKLQIFCELHFSAPRSIWLAVALQFGLAILLGFLLWFSGRVNVNRFSMHAVYRNRLTRAFLGSARLSRSPDPFTGFDPGDNPSLHDFGGGETAGKRLFPVFNIALNVTSGGDAAMAERKAESFTATPLHCGSASLHRPEQGANELPRGAFVATRDYAGMETLADTNNKERGLTLGTAVTVSGAAMSPNAGYHSSRVTAFLMTLFNVRLGVWLPNPARASERVQLAKPKNSLGAIMSELLGQSTDTRQSVYLSDGGHFENLGLYEMLRRRCRWIVAVDAGRDDACTLLDFGNAVRKASIDLGVKISINTAQIRGRDAPSAVDDPPAIGFAVGSIDYGGNTLGALLYIKPGFLPQLPADIRAYGLANIKFPHESTAEQWFTESQFESYRALGMWQMQFAMRGMKDGEIRDLIAAAKAQSH